MTEDEKIYYYAGKRLLNNNKLGHIFESLDNKTLIFTGRFTAYITKPFIVQLREDNKFTYKPSLNSKEERAKLSQEKVDKWKSENTINEQLHKEIQAEKFMEKMFKDINNMTINDLKKYCDSPQKKRALRLYLDETIFWR